MTAPPRRLYQAREVTCPGCGARYGDPCVDRHGQEMRGVHRVRNELSAKLRRPSRRGGNG